MAIYKSFTVSTFNHCPTVWMFFGIANAQKLDKIPERALQFVFKDRTYSYEILLEKACAHSLEMSTIYLSYMKCTDVIIVYATIYVSPLYSQRKYS